MVRSVRDDDMCVGSMCKCYLEGPPRPAELPSPLPDASRPPISPLTPLNHDILVVSHLLGDPVSPAALRSMQGCSLTLVCGCSRSHLSAHTDR